MDLINYIKSYDYSNYFLNFKEEFLNQETVKKYLATNPEDNFIKFAEEFWTYPNNSIEILKEKYHINKQVSYLDILKAYPTKEYLKFLKMFYSLEYSRDYIIKEFAIPYNKLQKLIIPIYFDNFEMYCPKCFNNSFEGSIDKHNLTDKNITYICKNCLASFTYNEMLTTEEAKVEYEKLTQEKIIYDQKISEINVTLNYIKCPKCQEQLQVIRDYDNLEYIIKCKTCNYHSDDIEKTLSHYEEWKKRVSTMIAIRAKEQELIDSALKTKKLDDIFFRKEEIIKIEHSLDSIRFAFKTCLLDKLQIWNKIFKEIQSCNRLERILLINIIDLVTEKNKKITATIGGNEVILYNYSPEEPLVFELIEKSKIIVTRQILKNLIRKNLIIVDEEQNYISVLPVIVENIDIIRNLMHCDDVVEPCIRYIIFEKQGFKCATCGEGGRHLNIVYLTSEKNVNDLSKMTALCDECNELYTINKIIIDGTITFEVDEMSEYKNLSWRFLMKYLPEVKGDEEVYNSIVNWEKKFDTNNIIKALAITIDKIKNNKLDGTIKGFLGYTFTILRNNFEAKNEIVISQKLHDYYNLDEWIVSML